MTLQAAVTFEYEIGEEVLARLAGAEPLRLDGPGAWRPPLAAWTIGSIVALRSDPAPRYLIAFRCADARWICWVGEAAIDGVV